MGKTLTEVYLHIIFSTKHRQPLIREPFDLQLYTCLGKLCSQMGTSPIQIGGHLDHVHILCRFSKHITLVDFMEKIKGSSSKWIKGLDDSLKEFYWQDGYGAFSVSPKDIEIVKRYIQNQARHHQTCSFQQEYLTILKSANATFDEKYLWD